MTKTVVVTGANSGIGLAITHELARRGIRVVMACRNLEKAQRAHDEVRTANPSADLDVVALDLADLGQVRRSAAEIAHQNPTIHGLINNAGLCPTSQHFTADGYELQIGTNYLGPFLFTHLLIPQLENAAASADDARIVHMSSVMHLFGSIDPSTFRGHERYFWPSAYGQSKLANALFSGALSRRLSPSIASNAMHPGGVDTGIYADAPALVHRVMRLALTGPEKAARLAADLVEGPSYTGKTGLFVSAQQPFVASRTARSESAQDALYELTCDLLNVAPIPTGSN